MQVLVQLCIKGATCNMMQLMRASFPLQCITLKIKCQYSLNERQCIKEMQITHCL